MAEDTSNTGDANDTGDDDGASTQQLGAAGEAALKAERERARKAERELKAASAKLKEIEDRDKTELQKATERAAAAEKALADATAQTLRFQVAAEKGLPAGLAARLHGSDAKELAADADKLLALLAGAGGGKGGPPAFNGGPRKTADGKTDMNALIRQSAGLG